MIYLSGCGGLVMKSSDIRGTSLRPGVPLLFCRIHSTCTSTFTLRQHRDRLGQLVSLKGIGAPCAEGLKNDGEEAGRTETQGKLTH